MKRQPHNQGFTLVELAIVLVIIGLLIGGILAAQSMIATSKVEAVAMQIGQFDAGVENFKTKYNYLPGDAPAFGGDGDGALTMSVASGFQGNTNEYTCEIVNFWNNMLPEQYTSTACDAHGTPAVLTGTTKNVPISKLGAANSYFIAVALSGSGNSTTASLPYQNFYGILNAPTSGNYASGYRLASTTSTNSAVKPQDLLALDKKIDDGDPSAGNVLSGSVTNTGGSGVGVLTGIPITNYCSAGNTYYLNHSGYECTPLIRIGASVNDPQ